MRIDPLLITAFENAVTGAFADDGDGGGGVTGAERSEVISAYSALRKELEWADRDGTKSLVTRGNAIYDAVVSASVQTSSSNDALLGEDTTRALDALDTFTPDVERWNG